MATPTWSRIAQAIKTRLMSVPGIGKVYDTYAVTDESSTGAKFREMYVDSQKKVNFGWITKSATSVNRTVSEDSGITSVVRGTAKVEYFYSMKTEDSANEKAALELFDRIIESFDKLDRTFGGVVNSHSLPEAVDITPVRMFQEVACHLLTFTIQFEYISTKTVTQEVLTEESQSGQYAEVEKISRALVETIKPFVVTEVVPSNSKVTLAYSCQSPEQAESQNYPADPRTDCPRIRFHLEDWTLEPATVSSGGQLSQLSIVGSFWVQLLQVPGQDHLGRLLRALQRISHAFLGNFNPALVVAVPGIISWEVTPISSGVVGEIEHDFKDPNLRISVGRVQIKFSGRIKIK